MLQFRYILTLLFSLSILQSLAQIELPEYSAEVGLSSQLSKKKPFYFYTQKDGKCTTSPAPVYSTLMLTSGLDTSKNFYINYGLEGHFRYSEHIESELVQAFTDIKFHFIKFLAGMKSETYESPQTKLTSGPMLFSRNAKPIPRVAIASDGWIKIPFTQNYAKIKGYISHGWLNDERYVKHTYLHHKYAYIKFGGKLPVNIYYGLQHAALWGGTSPRYGKLPNDMEAFSDIIIPGNGDTSELNILHETRNTLGDHRGSHNFGIQVKHNNYNFDMYLQTIFEDKSGIWFNNFPDGLWGIRIKNNNPEVHWFNEIVYEYLHTKHQGGVKIDTIAQGYYYDNYFNNGLYQSGWSYHGFTIGHPFINAFNENSVLNNRVQAHYFALSGKLAQHITYLTKFSFGENYGEYLSNFKKKQHFTCLMGLKIALKTAQSFIQIEAALDYDEIYGKNFGIKAAFIKRGLLFK